MSTETADRTDTAAAPDTARARSARRPDRDLVHSGVVRTTHWLLVIGFLCLIVSGTAILISHPRLYWGETGTVDSPSLIDLPFGPIYGHSGWGRYLHFLSAWVLVASGFVYVAAGIAGRHFRSRLLPARDELRLRAIDRVLRDRLRRRRPPEAGDAGRYNVVQQLAYLVVVFGLLPAMVWTGLAMSPTMTAQYPFLATALGGHQSARTLHFAVANLLAGFVVLHVAMLFLAGFGVRLRAMITGYGPPRGGPS